LTTLTSAINGAPDVRDALRARWRDRVDIDLTDVRSAADQLDRSLPALTRSQNAVAELAALLSQPEGEVLFIWCAACAGRRDARLARLLTSASSGAPSDRIAAAARARVTEGPLVDALTCAPLLGRGDRLALPENQQAAARIEILIWEAGAT